MVAIAKKNPKTVDFRREGLRVCRLAAAGRGLASLEEVALFVDQTLDHGLYDCEAIWKIARRLARQLGVSE